MIETGRPAWPPRSLRANLRSFLEMLEGAVLDWLCQAEIWEAQKENEDRASS